MKVTIVLSNVAVFASGQDQQQCADNAGLEDCVLEHDERDESFLKLLLGASSDTTTCDKAYGQMCQQGTNRNRSPEVLGVCCDSTICRFGLNKIFKK